MRRMALNKRHDNKSCKCRSPFGLSKDNSFWARGAGDCVACVPSSSWNARRYPEILTVFTKSSRELLMSFRIETKFLLESVSQIFHLGEVATFVISEHALENIDCKKCLDLEPLLHIGIWCVDKIATEISKTNLFRCACTYR